MLLYRIILCYAILCCCITTTCQQLAGDIKLVGGTGSYEGRVELYYNGSWGSVCDDYWDVYDARVVCRQIGYPNAYSAVIQGRFGHSSGAILLDDVECNGTETSLLDCAHSPIGQSNCQHYEDAGVVCIDDFTIRLVDRTHAGNLSEGRVEVFHNGAWGTVCDDYWTMADAGVVCRELGYTGALRETKYASFGAGSGQIWMDDVSCLGDEASLSYCPFSGWGIHNCRHSEDAGVICINPNITLGEVLPIRLMQQGDLASSEGRIEVQDNNGTWGTVCDDYFTLQDAQIACQQLHYIGAVQVHRNAYYGQGSGTILLDDVYCRGYEAGLSQCLHSDLGHSNCAHSEDVGIVCSNDSSVTQNYKLAIRLVGPNNASGRVEVNYNGTWGAVCDHKWGLAEANVACRQLGFPSAIRATFKSYFGASNATEPIWLDDVSCTGNEDLLSECRYLGFGDTGCGHSSEAGVVCEDSDITLHVRLVGGASSAEGRVEVLFNGTWGTVCDDSWDFLDGRVICRQLGFKDALSAPRFAQFGSGPASQPIWLDDVYCAGNESQIGQCVHSAIGVHNCRHYEDASVVCSLEGIPAIRLMGSDMANAGRVEVNSYGNIWKTICSSSWTLIEATVACNQLGYSGAERLARRNEFGRGSGAVINHIVCEGYESYLLNCSYSYFGYVSQSCYNHEMDAGVVCIISQTSLPLRLVAGSSAYEGRVEVFYSSVWGAVCDDYWSINDATVVCRELGYNTLNAKPVTNAAFGKATGPIWLDDVMCDGEEFDLISCTKSEFAQHDCTQFEAAGVVCDGPVPPQYPIQLFGSGVPYEGRVDVYMEGEWRKLCGYSIDYETALVICKQLHYASVSRYYTHSNFGQSIAYTNYSIASFNCSGLESEISECSYSVESDPCSQASVTCSIYQDDEYPIRLVGGSHSNEGAVQIFYQGEWGKICSDEWDQPDADVVCKELGYPGALRASFSYYYYSSTPTHLSEVNCEGTENRLVECPNAGWRDEYCSSYSSAGVVCIPPLSPVRITGGGTDSQGEVQMYREGAWSNICGSYWGLEEAIVVCRELGYKSVIEASSTRTSINSSASMVLDDVICTGTESLLSSCASKQLINQSCTTQASASCSDDAITPVSIPLALRGSDNTPYEGRLEVYSDNEWKTVCSTRWSTANARVVCRNLGYEGPVEVFSTYRTAFYTSQSSVWDKEIICTGTEQHIGECYIQTAQFNYYFCKYHFMDVGIRCMYGVEKQQQETYAVRLVGTNSSAMGRVEVLYHGIWAGVCGSGWSLEDAAVVCSQLGFPSAEKSFNEDIFSEQVSRLSWLDNVRCLGTESNLNSCKHVWSLQSCYYTAATIICSTQPANPIPIRLAGGDFPNEGRVEILFEEVWGTLCSDGLSMMAPGVICRSLGYQGARDDNYTLSNASGLLRHAPVYLSNLYCYGNETFIQDCLHAPWQQVASWCTGNQHDVSVSCKGSLFSVKLLPTENAAEGRVMVEYDGVWGSVCHHGWDFYDTKVVCSNLGYAFVKNWGAVSTFGENALYTNMTGYPIWLDDVNCLGQEAALEQCQHGNWGLDKNSYCDHTRDVYVLCSHQPNQYYDAETFELRLTQYSTDQGSYLPTNSKGRVEVFLHGIWGTVCVQSSYFGQDIAKVVCRQLNLPTDNAKLYLDPNNAHSVNINTPIQIYYINCNGEEANITQCYTKLNSSKYYSYYYSCSHQSDLYVDCAHNNYCDAYYGKTDLILSDTSNTIPAGASVAVSCPKGKRLYGANTLYCHLGNTWHWDGAAPECATVCSYAALGPLKKVLIDGKQVNASSYVRIDTVIQVSCLIGYALNLTSNPMYSCISDNTWNSTLTDVTCYFAHPATKSPSVTPQPIISAQAGLIAGLVLGVIILVIVSVLIVLFILLIVRYRNYISARFKGLSRNSYELVNRDLDDDIDDVLQLPVSSAANLNSQQPEINSNDEPLLTIN